jgi:hypothetical protein
VSHALQVIIAQAGQKRAHVLLLRVPAGAQIGQRREVLASEQGRRRDALLHAGAPHPLGAERVRQRVEQAAKAKGRGRPQLLRRKLRRLIEQTVIGPDIIIVQLTNIADMHRRFLPARRVLAASRL